MATFMQGPVSFLNGKCGKLGILDTIRGYSRRAEEFSHYLAMALGGLRNPYSLGGSQASTCRHAGAPAAATPFAPDLVAAPR
ncbi:MAG: hypothetical protein ABI831_08020 [Betaproteobacteria bacterium]